MEYKFGTYGEIAHSDLESAEIIFKSGGPAKAVVFYSQQACEKILKHYLQLKLKNDVELTSLLKSHKLRRLSTAAEIEALWQYRADLADLQDAYFEGRYPGEDYTLPTMQIAGMLLEAAKAIVCTVDSAIAEFNATNTHFFEFEG